MRTHTTSIEIAASARDAFTFVADGEKLPVWAIGFAKAIEARSDDTWLVTLASGDQVPMRIGSDRAAGTVDFVMQPAPDVEATAAHSRVVPRAGGSLYTFSMHQAPDMDDGVFDAQVAELERELTVLKAHLETACPL